VVWRSCISSNVAKAIRPSPADPHQGPSFSFCHLKKGRGDEIVPLELPVFEGARR
jgi:hypothetical protein